MSTVNQDRLQPIAQWQELDVVFPSVADTDITIQHTLAPPTPEHINYYVIRQGQACSVYHDSTGTRKPWASGYIILRSSVASAKVTLLLTVSHGQRTLTF